MIGLKSEFNYFQCESYIALQIEAVPDSELYEKDISLNEFFEEGRKMNKYFSRKEIAEFRKQTIVLNETHQGRRFAVHLKNTNN